MPTFDTPQPVSARLSLGFVVANVRVTASDRTDTTVDVQPMDASSKADVKVTEQTRIEYADGRLEVRAPKLSTLFGRTGSVDVTITLPSGSRLQGETGMGELLCEGRLGECRFKTGYGEIRLDQDGGVTVDRAHAGVTAKTANGSVRIGEVTSGAVTLETAAGSLEVGIHTGTAAWLDLNTVAGRIRNELAAAAGPDNSEETVEVRARTYVGDIIVRRT